MKAKRILALALVLVLSVSAFAATAIAATANDTLQETSESTVQTKKQKPHCKKDKVEAPENAIGKDAAKEAALKDAGLTAEQAGKVRARVSKTEDGTIIYKVRFSANDKLYSYKIDVLTGEVIERTVQTAEEHEAAKEAARAKKSETADAAGAESSYGKKHGKRMKSDAANGTEENAAASERPARSRSKGGKSANDTTEQTDPTVSG